MSNPYRDNGGKLPSDPNWYSKGGYLPGRPDPVRLKDGERLWKKEGKNLVEYEHQLDNFGENWRLVRLGTLPPEDNYIENPKKRHPIVKVRREVLSNSYGTLTRWNWRCHICGLGRAQSGWWIAYETAAHHAHNHH